MRLEGPGAMAGGTAEGHGSSEQRAATSRRTDESSPAAVGCRVVSPGGVHLALALTQDTEVEASPVRASGAGCHAEVIARILDLNGVDLQGAAGQELQPGEEERRTPMGALHGQTATHQGHAAGKVTSVNAARCGKCLLSWRGDRAQPFVAGQ